eukprot:s1298_g2.t1
MTVNCNDTLTEGEQPHLSEAGQKRARESQKVEPFSKRQKEAKEVSSLASSKDSKEQHVTWCHLMSQMSHDVT